MADAMHRSTDTALIASSQVQGRAVFDRAGEKLGSVKDVFIDKVSGEVRFATLAVGGLLGVGETFRPLPWSLLVYDVKRDGFIVDVDRAALEGSPAYAADWLTGDESWGGEVRTYYAGLGGGANLV
jgi:sporulation protein YlmC with PRC-barrel domain